MRTIELWRVYVAWLTSTVVAIPIGILYYAIGMLVEYGSLKSEDFEGLVHFFTGGIISIFSVGIISAFIVFTVYRRRHLGTVLAKNILLLSLLYGFGTIICTFVLYLFFMPPNVLSIAIFFLIPWLAHSLTYDKGIYSPAFAAVVSLLIANIIFGAINYSLLISSGPPSL